MITITRSRARHLVAPLALAGSLGTVAFVGTPVAGASCSCVTQHVQRADVDLHAVASLAASGHMSVPLAALVNQLNSAGKASINLELHARTPNAEVVAAKALALVGKEEVKAEGKLASIAGATSGVEASLVGQAELTMEQGRAKMTSALGGLTAEAKLTAQSDAHVIAQDLAGLVRAGEPVVSKLVGSLTASLPTCAPATATMRLGSTASANLAHDILHLDAVGSLLGTTGKAEIGALSGLEAKLSGALQLGVHAAGDCATQDSVPEAPVSADLLVSVLAGA